MSETGSEEVDEITTRLAYAMWDATHTIKLTFPEDINEYIKKAQNVRWWLERNVVLTLKSNEGDKSMSENGDNLLRLGSFMCTPDHGVAMAHFVSQLELAADHGVDPHYLGEIICRYQSNHLTVEQAVDDLKQAIVEVME